MCNSTCAKPGTNDVWAAWRYVGAMFALSTPISVCFQEVWGRIWHNYIVRMLCELPEVRKDMRARPPPIERRGEKAGALNAYLESAPQVMSEHYAFLEGDTAVIESLHQSCSATPEVQDAHRAAPSPTQRWVEYSSCHYTFRNELSFGFIPTHGGTFAGAGEVGGVALNAAGFNAAGGAAPGVELNVGPPGVAYALEFDKFSRAIAYLMTQFPDKAGIESAFLLAASRFCAPSAQRATYYGSGAGADRADSMVDPTSTLQYGRVPYHLARNVGLVDPRD
eukprot:708539-Amphidinium_carterae.2